jgi:signal transduction histidine kinase
MVNCFLMWLFISAGVLLIFSFVFYYAVFQKRRSNSYSSLLEGIVDSFTKEVNSDFSLLVKKMHHTFNASAVFLGEYRADCSSVDLHVVTGRGNFTKVVTVDVNDIIFSQTKNCSSLRMRAADSDILKLLNQTGRPFLQIVPLVLSSGPVIGLICVVCNGKPRNHLFIKQLLRLCASGIVSEYERVANEKELVCRLQQAALSRKMESMSMMARNLAHDMNNQLNAVLGYSDLLYKKIPREVQLKKFLDGLSSSARIGVDLIDKLIIFARRGKNANVNVEIHHLIESAAAVLHSSNLAAGLTISTCLNAIDTIVRGDPALLKKMLNDLSFNAIDAMPLGGKLSLITENFFFDKDTVVGTSYLERIPKGKYVSISVCDEGVGMDANVKDHLFEPFFTTKTDKKRMGLGLATVWGCVKNHDGYVGVSSNIGVGSTVTVYLPINQ